MDPQLDKLKFDANGLIPIIVQDVANGQVLMMAYMNREAIERNSKPPHAETDLAWQRRLGYALPPVGAFTSARTANAAGCCPRPWSRSPKMTCQRN